MKVRELVKLGAHIKKRRLFLSLSQEELSMRSNLDRAYCGKVERGEVNISLLSLIRIASALECNLTDLLKD